MTDRTTLILYLKTEGWTGARIAAELARRGDKVSISHVNETARRYGLGARYIQIRRRGV